MTYARFKKREELLRANKVCRTLQLAPWTTKKTPKKTVPLVPGTW